MQPALRTLPLGWVSLSTIQALLFCLQSMYFLFSCDLSEAFPKGTVERLEVLGDALLDNLSSVSALIMRTSPFQCVFFLMQCKAQIHTCYLTLWFMYTGLLLLSLPPLNALPVSQQIAPHAAVQTSSLGQRFRVTAGCVMLKCRSSTSR